jgi:POT family proton-dependent oligopeptide transporter
VAGWSGILGTFSYYGIQALLVLYMTHQLLQPGHADHVLGFAPFHRLLEIINGKPLSGVALASAA